MHVSRSPAAAVLLAGIVGCTASQPQVAVYPVKGRVVQNGKPATGALVLLHPVGGTLPEGVSMTPNGTVGADGTFVVYTFVPGDGAPAGEYVVGIRWAPAVVSEDKDTGDDRLRGKYSPEKSPIRFTVKAGENEIPEIRLP